MFVVAKMALKKVGFSMKGEGEVAMGTFNHMAAGGANLHPVVAAPVEKEECLLSQLESFFEPVEEFIAKVGKSASDFIGSLHVDDLYFGKGCGGRSGFQFVKLIFADFGVVSGFNRGGCAAEYDDALF